MYHLRDALLDSSACCLACARRGTKIFALTRYDLSNSILQRFAGFESRKLHSWDLDFLTRVAGIYTGAGSSLGNAECAETCYGYVFAFLEALCNSVKYRIQNC